MPKQAGELGVPVNGKKFEDSKLTEWGHGRENLNPSSGGEKKKKNLLLEPSEKGFVKNAQRGVSPCTKNGWAARGAETRKRKGEGQNDGGFGKKHSSHTVYTPVPAVKRRKRARLACSVNPARKKNDNCNEEGVLKGKGTRGRGKRPKLETGEQEVRRTSGQLSAAQVNKPPSG